VALVDVEQRLLAARSGEALDTALRSDATQVVFAVGEFGLESGGAQAALEFVRLGQQRVGKHLFHRVKPGWARGLGELGGGERARLVTVIAVDEQRDAFPNGA